MTRKFKTPGDEQAYIDTVLAPHFDRGFGHGYEGVKAVPHTKHPMKREHYLKGHRQGAAYAAEQHAEAMKEHEQPHWGEKK